MNGIDADTTAKYVCPVCAGMTSLLDVVDFNKCCEELRGTLLPRSGMPVSYYLCESCEFCFAPDIHRWSLDEFGSKIYNAEYVQVDPDYVERRPLANARHLIDMFPDAPVSLRHLDYGGGDGLLSDTLFAAGWQSRSYDPFVDRDVSLGTLGKFDLITAYEVFEHVPDVAQLALNLVSLLADDGIVLFTTLLSDGNVFRNQRLTWWYASPRNGHISLFSRTSLISLGSSAGFKFGSCSPAFHAYWKVIPPWARHVIGNGTTA